MSPAKRKQASRGAQGKSTKQAKQPKQEGQVAVSDDIDVPIDEGFGKEKKNVATEVYLDDDGLIYDASLNQTNVGNNNNKFYRLQLLQQGDEFFTHTRWGRVGEDGQVKTMGPYDLDAAMEDFEKKFKAKTGHSWEDREAEPKKGKYTFLEKSYEDDEDEAEDVEMGGGDDGGSSGSDLPIATQRLMELIFNQNHFNSVLESIGYNKDKLPLGKLSKTTLKKGFEHLHELASLIKHPKLARNKYDTTQKEAIEDFTNKYYSTIPHIFGRGKPPMIDNTDILSREVAMLDTLSDMEVANKIMSSTSSTSSSSKQKDAHSVSQLDHHFTQLGLDELTPLDHKSPEYLELQRLLLGTSSPTHNIRYRLQDIFRLSRPGEDAHFEKSRYAQFRGSDRNRKLLWHGSRTTNYGGILSQGLRIAPPEAPANGYAFGKGVYLADVSSKSAGYCVPGLSGNVALLLLCEVELGNPMNEIPSGDWRAEEVCREKKCCATLGTGRVEPGGWRDAGVLSEKLDGVEMPDAKKKLADSNRTKTGYLEFNEYIVYDVTQVRLRYLFKVGM